LTQFEIGFCLYLHTNHQRSQSPHRAYGATYFCVDSKGRAAEQQLKPIVVHLMRQNVWSQLNLPSGREMHYRIPIRRKKDFSVGAKKAKQKSAPGFRTRIKEILLY